jgi:hypothetical protein
MRWRQHGSQPPQWQRDQPAGDQLQLRDQRSEEPKHELSAIGSFKSSQCALRPVCRHVTATSKQHFRFPLEKNRAAELVLVVLLSDCKRKREPGSGSG